MSRDTEAPRCATCGHGYDWHVATGTVAHCRGCCGTGRDCMHAFVPPADAKPAEPIGRDPRLTPEQNQRASFAYGNTKLSNSDVTWEMCVQAVLAKDAEPAPRAQPAEAERCACGGDLFPLRQCRRCGSFYESASAPARPPAPAAPVSVRPGGPESNPEGDDWRDQLLACGHTMRTWVFFDENDDMGMGVCGECVTRKYHPQFAKPASAALQEGGGLSIIFKVNLWYTIARWAYGNLTQREQAVVAIERMIEGAIRAALREER